MTEGTRITIACGPDGCTVTSEQHPLPQPPADAERIRRRRVALGLSQKEVEVKTGIRAQRLNHIEHGTALPTASEWGQLVGCYKRLEAE